MVGAYRRYATVEFNWAAHHIPVRLFMRSLSSRPLPRRITRRGQVHVHAQVSSPGVRKQDGHRPTPLLYNT